MQIFLICLTAKLHHLDELEKLNTAVEGRDPAHFSTKVQSPGRAAFISTVDTGTVWLVYLTSKHESADNRWAMFLDRGPGRKSM